MNKKIILFTLTTFLSSEGKLEQCVKCLQSIQKYEPNIKKKCYILVINECGKTKGQFLKKKFPWIDKIIDKGNRKDKTGKKCGQASSLNIAISYLKRKKECKYWLHWEESWIATKPFLQLCLDAMKMNIDCIQISEDDGHDSIQRLHTPHNRYIFIQHTPDQFYEFKTLCKCNSKKCCCQRKKKQFKYWLHWEESWLATRPFLQLCLDAMKMNIDCIQISEDDGHESIQRLHTPHNRYIFIQSIPDDFKINCKSNFKKSCCKRNKNQLKTKSKKIKQHPRCKECYHKKCDDKWWPLWSLRPGMDKKEKVLSIGYFNTDPKFWPVHFELEWAYNWITQPGGVTKGISICTKRQQDHQSFSEKFLK